MPSVPIAYLILAHRRPLQLARLIDRLRTSNARFYERLLSSGKLFARKLDDRVDSEILDLPDREALAARAGARLSEAAEAVAHHGAVRRPA